MHHDTCLVSPGLELHVYTMASCWSLQGLSCKHAPWCQAGRFSVRIAICNTVPRWSLQCWDFKYAPWSMAGLFSAMILVCITVPGWFFHKWANFRTCACKLSTSLSEHPATAHKKNAITLIISCNRKPFKRSYFVCDRLILYHSFE